MDIYHRVSTITKAGRELGIERLWRYAVYRLQLNSGYYALRVKDGRSYTELPNEAFSLYPVVHLPEPGALRELLGASGQKALSAEADEIVFGQVRLFGGALVELNLGPASSHLHWTALESGRDLPRDDIKFIWEPARFGWAFTLGRAYHVSGDERYPQAYWDYLERFLQANPPYYGQHWRSAQEVALRLIALVFAGQVFKPSQCSTSERMEALGRAIAVHAGRIPPSMSYARAQNNNHLLVEAVGLYTAANVLIDHPSANTWRELGWQWAQQAFLSQISEDGVYMQQSTNYHRLMLHAALWLDCLVRYRNEALPAHALERLLNATCWLQAIVDPISGETPNLGPNDGANILPLSQSPFRNYRPVLQAASGAFLGNIAYPAGRWDETSLWLGIDLRASHPVDAPAGTTRNEPLVLRSGASWTYLRAAHFNERPGHADQLHVDLWWRGHNIAQDAGTYLYNASPPWDNALSHSIVHNTVTVDDQDQMTWAGRFLWLDWAQASQIQREKASDGSWERVSAVHDGYRRAGVIHRRTVTAFHPEKWRVEDELIDQSKPDNAVGPDLSFRLHWLLPDWQWNLEKIEEGAKVYLISPEGEIALAVMVETGDDLKSGHVIQLVRAGEVLVGDMAASPVLGWVSPTYGVKEPALSFSLTLRARLPLKFVSQWIFPSA